MLAHLGDAFRLEDLSQTHVDGFVRARRAGELGAKRRKAEDRAVRDDTIRQNLNWLASLLRWARGFRVGGRRLMATNPLDGVRFPREKNVRRPVASEERYRKTLEQAPAVDPTGRLETLLALARYTGRRINAMLQLRASDLLLSDAPLRRALAAAGVDPALAKHMPNGAIRWRPYSRTSIRNRAHGTLAGSGNPDVNVASFSAIPVVNDVVYASRTCSSSS